MNNNLSITINVQIGCTPNLENLLGRLVGDAPQQRTAVNPVVIATTEEPRPAPEPAKVIAEPVAIEKPVATESPVKTEITDAQLRQVIKACRERILGGTDDPFKRSRITDTIKQHIEAEYHVSHSTEIPQDARPAFVEFCENLVLVDDDNAPF